MKLIRFALTTAFLAAGALVAPETRAATGCQDDPERCVERGASVQRTAVVAGRTPQSVVTPAVPALANASRRSAPVPGRPAAKTARTTPRPPANSASATPGMGMLLKLSSGTGGDGSWFPSRAADNSGVSWIL